MSKSFWLASAGMFTLAATPAFAQDNSTPTSEPAPAQQGGDVATDETSAIDEDFGPEIVVTAQGRTQVLQDVPIAVSVVNAESMQNSGANDIRQLNQLAPSLLVSSTGTEANGSARIRGIGTVGDNPGLESSVAVFVDGVYRSRSGIGLNELGEIERVEVLRGPQGTLFGRNASAGLLNIVSKSPNLNDVEGYGELSYGNYDYIRAAGGVTGPLGDTIGARLDAVYVRRDGFYFDENNDTDVNDRDRIFVRGQLVFEPSDALRFRLIGDYTRRDESCCGAVYLDRAFNPLIGDLNNPAVPLSVGGLPPSNGNNIINVLVALGQNPARFSNPFNRILSVTPGRGYEGFTRDGGASLQFDWDLGGASLTSISAYRYYKSGGPGDIDYSTVDILFREDDDRAFRKFETYSQEFRLQASLFDDRVDFLVGAYFASEDLTVSDNLRFGNQYGRFATCRLVSGGGLAALFSPTSPGCLAARPAVFGAASPIIFAGIDRLDSVNNRGSNPDVYRQDSRNYAFFTHNIFNITDELAVTLGARYTNETKDFDATFANDNTACPAQQAALSPFLTNPGLAAVSGGLISLTCQGNATSELQGVSISDDRDEDEFTGTAVLSFKPSRDFLFYGSYSRGYKAGGFNLDRSALKSPIPTFASVGGAQALVGNLQFDPEINNAYEIGMKYGGRRVTLNAAIFRQQFSSFQLNTFNGTVFLVQTVNGCNSDLGGADRDQNASAGGSNFNAAAPTTGACAADDVGYGVSSQGIELEGFITPHRDVRITLGVTFAETEYRDNLVGNDTGAPLDPALRKLPGDNLSNAPEMVATGSFGWTPRIGTGGLTGLFYIDGRLTDDYNTGSDLFPQKEQDAYLIVNARIGIRGRNERWSLEAFAQNLFDTDYTQVAFNTPFQAGTTSPPFVDPQFPGGRQIFSSFLAEPRTYGVTGRFRF